MLLPVRIPQSMQTLMELPPGGLEHDERCFPCLSFIMASEYLVVDTFVGSEFRGRETFRIASSAVHVGLKIGYGSRHPRFLLCMLHRFPILANNRSDRSRTDNQQID